MTQNIGRPPKVAPPGRVTLQRAAELLKISYATVYRLRDRVPFEQDDSDVITIAKTDLPLIRGALRKPASGDKRPIMVRPTAEDAERWEAAIAASTRPGNKPVPISRWLVELANKAANKTLRGDCPDRRVNARPRSQPPARGHARSPRRDWVQRQRPRDGHRRAPHRRA